MRYELINKNDQQTIKTYKSKVVARTKRDTLNAEYGSELYSVHAYDEVNGKTYQQLIKE